MLRSEQDEEFQRVLAADREREQRAEAQRRAADEQQSQIELDAAIELSRTLDKEASLKRKRDRLVAEPPPGPDTTKLRLQLPNGSKIDRRFPSSATVQSVRDFIDVYFGDNDILIESFSLSTNFPRKTFEDNNLSLRESVSS